MDHTARTAVADASSSLSSLTHASSTRSSLTSNCRPTHPPWPPHDLRRRLTCRSPETPKPGAAKPPEQRRSAKLDDPEEKRHEDSLLLDSLRSSIAAPTTCSPPAPFHPRQLEAPISLLVDPIVFESQPFPLGGMTRQLVVPPSPEVCGQILFLQLVHLDAGAAQGLAFSPGARLVLGT